MAPRLVLARTPDPQKTQTRHEKMRTVCADHLGASAQENELDATISLGSLPPLAHGVGDWYVGSETSPRKARTRPKTFPLE